MQETQTRTASYWEARFRLLEEAKQKKVDTYVHDLDNAIQKSIKDIEDKIETFIRRYSINEGMSLNEATKYLTEGEFTKFKMSLDEYIRLGQENAVHYSTDVAKQLERASLEYRITRLAALELEIKAEAAKIYGLTEHITYGMIGELYNEFYARTAFEIFKGTGVLNLNFSLPDMEILDLIARQPWSRDGQTFSIHLWRDQTMFVNDLMDTLLEEFIQGQGYEEASRNLSKLVTRPLSDCRRVIYTESAFFLMLSQMKCYEDNGIEKYRFLCEFNTRVCKTCQDMNEEAFEVRLYRQGVNAPPMHPHCRCTTTPLIDGDNIPGYVEIGRMGRDEEGKSVMFPPGMTYEEWYEQAGKILEEKQSMRAKR